MGGKEEWGVGGRKLGVEGYLPIIRRIFVSQILDARIFGREEWKGVVH